MYGTTKYGLFYKNCEKLYLFGFTNSDYVGDLDDRSTCRYVFMMGSALKLNLLFKEVITWCSKKQPLVMLSSIEAEFVAATFSACQALWLRNILEVLQFMQQGSTQIFCDNSSTIKLSKNPFFFFFHGKCKNIDMRYRFFA